MSEQKTQVQRAFDKLVEACPKEWVICQQQVLIEDLQASNLEGTEELTQLRVDVGELKAANAEAIAKNDAAVGDRG